MKKIPMRMCIACREMKPKDSLIRIVNSQDGIELDPSGKKNGRGAYICNNIDCIQKCIKTHALNRAYGTEVEQKTYDKLLEDFIGKNN